MHFNFGTVLAITAFLAALALMKSDRIWALVALVVAGVQASVALGLLTIGIATFKIDIVLPALLAVSGAICWSKVATKAAITAATTITLIGAMELLLALHVLT
jgi:hypothetical protein